MDEQRLKELLTRADAGHNAVADPAEVTGSILRRRARRSRVRRAGVAAVMLAGIGVGISQLTRTTKHEPDIANVPAISDRAEADRLGRQAAAWLATARRAEAADRLARAQANAARLRDAIGLERERAATVMLRQGDWRRSRGESGADEYRRAAELFDGTRAAAEARARLDQG